MSVTSRFACSSSGLSLVALLAKAGRPLWLCCALGVLIHLSLTQAGGVKTQRRTTKPLTTHFVKREPRLTKPLELKKLPRPRQRQVRRTMVSVEARLRRADTVSFGQAARIVASLTRPGACFARVVSTEASSVEPTALAQAVEGAKDAQHRVDMSLEMVDVQALDTGEYHAMVIQDPTDKKAIKGFLHLAVAYSNSIWFGKKKSFPNRQRWAMHRLAESMNRYTNIETDVTGLVPLESAEFLRVPWVYAATALPFAASEAEATNLGRYMLTGGLFCGDSSFFSYDMGYGAFRQLIEDALLTQGLRPGVHWRIERLPNIHPIYHCFFDFERAPRASCISWWNLANWQDLEGVQWGERLMATVSRLWLWHAWGDWGPGVPDASVRASYGHGDPTRLLQFGVNLIIFALTQEGSITHRLTDSVK